MTHVVSVADIRNFQAAQIAEALLQREEIGEALAGVIEIGKRVDHRQVRIFGELAERFLLENARDDAIDPAREAFGHVAYRFAFTQVSDRVIEKNRSATQASDADFERNPGPQRGLFENQRQE